MRAALEEGGAEAEAEAEAEEAEEAAGFVGNAVGSFAGYAVAGVRWFRPLA